MDHRLRAALLFSLLVPALAACQSVPQSSGSAAAKDGSSPELAVDLSAARTEFDGIRAQKAWLDQHYPGAQVKSQALIAGKKFMDMLTIVLPSGEEKNIYFDISSYFGKL